MKLTDKNRLSITNPYLLEEWDFEKNIDLQPHKISKGSGKKVWWICKRKHFWQASVDARVRGKTGCPYCSGNIVSDNSIGKNYIELIKEWSPRNKISPFKVARQSNIKYWWRCSKFPKDHEWKATPNNRTIRKTGCPFCSGRKAWSLECLAKTHPHLVKEWHQELNGNLTPYDVKRGSSIKVYWQCINNPKHIWKISPCVRTTKRTTGCPVCKESHGEKRIGSFLLQKEYKFDREVRFDTCRNKFTLPFDFSIKLSNGKLVLVEYNGQQHYKNFGIGKWIVDEIEFKKLQKRDNIKKKWAKDNKIPLLIISYKNFNKIETILERFLNKYNDF
jgi:Probable Zinc-ribbon domain